MEKVLLYDDEKVYYVQKLCYDEKVCNVQKLCYDEKVCNVPDCTMMTRCGTFKSCTMMTRPYGTRDEMDQLAVVDIWSRSPKLSQIKHSPRDLRVLSTPPSLVDEPDPFTRRPVSILPCLPLTEVDLTCLECPVIERILSVNRWRHSTYTECPLSAGYLVELDDDEVKLLVLQSLRPFNLQEANTACPLSAGYLPQLDEDEEKLLVLQSLQPFNLQEANTACPLSAGYLPQLDDDEVKLLVLQSLRPFNLQEANTACPLSAGYLPQLDDDEVKLLVLQSLRPFNLQEANTACPLSAGYLPQLDDDEVKLLVLQSLRAVGGSDHFPLGGTDKDSEGHFVYFNSELPVPQLTWKKGEPNNASGGKENCMDIY
ncbi:hypothetical protein RRG08_022518 [Elysia crispata]|uniref:Uncharacterized protein n=1 Tax=Elysia crispata TaxID=231223 RepID=A0AAE1D883_9GAST|nr:hypothetical protein RRG08_022518 [Elysia crispata]